MQDYRKLKVWPKARTAAAIRIFRRFGFYSLGSTNELEYDFLLAKDLRFIPAALHDHRAEQIAEVRRMLSSFVQTLHSGR